MSIKILFLNQTTSPMFNDLVLATIDEFGSIGFCTDDFTLANIKKLKLIRGPHFNNSSFLTRLSSWLSYFLVASFKSLIEPNKPLLFIVTNPPFMPILGWVVNKLKRQRYVLLFYDIYPEALVRFAGISNDSIIARFWRLLNRLAIQNAEYTITISPRMLKILIQYNQKYGPPRLKIIPTWVDIKHIRPIPKEHNWFAQKYRQVNKLTIIYSGQIGNVHDLSHITHVAEQLKDYKDIHFVIISNSPKRKLLKIQALRQRLNNMTFLPLQDKNIVPYSLACGDIGMVALAIGAEDISMPSKTYFTMAAGSALLGFSSSTSDLAALIHDHDCGINISPEDIHGAVQAILIMRNHPELLKRYRENARQIAVQYFSKTVCTPKMLDVIREIFQLS